jgi:hypothetical protein
MTLPDDLPRWADDFNAWALDMTRCDAFRCMAEGTERYAGQHLCPAHFQERATATIDRGKEDA